MSASLPQPSPGEISIVMQGPVVTEGYRQTDGPLTAGALRQLRKLLPGAEIILSTWEGTDTEGLEADRVVYCQDPGAQKSQKGPKKGTTFNLNRQLVSVQAGLKEANRPYTLRTRTDLAWHHAGFLDYWTRYPKRGSLLKLSEERLMVCSNFTANPHRAPMPAFSVCDWFTFGRTADVKAYWSAPLFPDSYIDWYEDNPRPLGPGAIPAMTRYSAEQYICLNWLKACGVDAEVEHYYDWTERNAWRLEPVLANNFIVLSQKETGLEFVKYPFRPMESWLLTYNHAEWQALYQHYCDPAALAEPAWGRFFKTWITSARRGVPPFRSLFNKLDSALLKYWLQPRSGPAK